MSAPEPPPDPAAVDDGVRPRRDRMATAAVVLVVAGLLLLVVYRLTASGERHSYSADATAPTGVSLVEGKQYSISVHGGVADAVPDPAALRCRIGAVGGGATSQLALTPEVTTTRAVNQVARFVSPLTGHASVTCEGLTGVFVDDAEDAGTDWSGLALLLGSLALVVGLPLALSVLRRRLAPARPPAESVAT